MLGRHSMLIFGSLRRTVFFYSHIHALVLLMRYRWYFRQQTWTAIVFNANESLKPRSSPSNTPLTSEIEGRCLEPAHPDAAQPTCILCGRALATFSHPLTIFQAPRLPIDHGRSGRVHRRSVSSPASRQWTSSDSRSDP